MDGGQEGKGTKRADCPGREGAAPKGPWTQVPRLSKRSVLSGTTGLPHGDSQSQNWTEAIILPTSQFLGPQSPSLRLYAGTPPISGAYDDKGLFLVPTVCPQQASWGCCAHITVVFPTHRPRPIEHLEHHSDDRGKETWRGFYTGSAPGRWYSHLLARTSHMAPPSPREPGRAILPCARRGASQKVR